MYLRKRLIAPLSVCVALVFACPAKAVSIEYIFTGSAAVTLDGVSSFSNYEIHLFGDTVNVTSGGGEFANIATSAIFTVGASSGTLLGISNEIVSNPSFDGGTVIFGQAQPSFFVAEGLSGLGSYDLTIAFPLTAGQVSQTPGSVFFTSLGNLSFDGIETMSFEAILSETPVPAALPLFATGLGGLGLLGWRKRRKVQATA